MELVWQSKSWEDYLYWQQTDKKTLSRINELVKDCLRSPYKGIGKPEPRRSNRGGSPQLGRVALFAEDYGGTGSYWSSF